MVGRLTLQGMSFAALRRGADHQGPISSESLSLVQLEPDVGTISGNLACRSSGRIDDQTGALTTIGCTPL